MKFKTGEHIVFIGSQAQINWMLVINDTYIVRNHAFDYDAADMFVSVSPITQPTSETSWYNEDLFLSLREFRKMKLNQINGNLLR
jgi:hypothetical protein